MANTRTYVERDSRGRERLVVSRGNSRRRSSSQRRSTRELLNDAEEREQVLIAQVQSLQTRLSFAERNEWQYQNLRREHQNLVNEHYQCRNVRAQMEAQVREVSRVEDLLADEEDKNEELKEKIRLLKRGSGHDGYRARFQEKVEEVELLRQRIAERENLIRLAETRVAEKNRTILYLKNYLRTHGFRVED